MYKITLECFDEGWLLVIAKNAPLPRKARDKTTTTEYVCKQLEDAFKIIAEEKE